VVELCFFVRAKVIWFDASTDLEISDLLEIYCPSNPLLMERLGYFLIPVAVNATELL
jgi:hypothetical protein